MTTRILPIGSELRPAIGNLGAMDGLPRGSELSREQQGARFVMRPLAFMEELRSRFGDVFNVHLAETLPWTMVCDPELIKAVFKAPSDVLHAGEGREVLKPVLGEHSIMLLDGQAHTEQRKLLLPPFGPSHAERHLEIMREAAERAFAKWTPGRPERSDGWMRAITLDTIMGAVFGLDHGERTAPLREVLSTLWVPGTEEEAGRPEFRAAIARVDELVYEEIDARSRARPAEAGDDVFSLLMAASHEDGTPMSRTEIRDELISLLAAGYETTATSLSWALDLLAHAPAARERVASEAPDGGGAYTEAAIKETLRMRPALPVIARVAKRPFDLGEHSVAPGTVVVPAVLLVHHRPDLYPEPAEFRPERFLDRQPEPHTWMPFGGGSRRCIGARFAMQEMQVVLAALLARFDLRPAENRPDAMRARNVILMPAKGARVVLEPR